MMEQYELIEQNERVRSARDGATVLRALREGLAAKEAIYCFGTGLSMPGRSLEPLVLFEYWPNVRTETTCLLAFDQSDSILAAALVMPRPMVVTSDSDFFEIAESSFFWKSLPLNCEPALVVVPFSALMPYQGVCVLGGFASTPTTRDLDDIDRLIDAGFRRLSEVGTVTFDRPGSLSPRERRIVELTAHGKTAGDIADILRISHRTVHAHLQNAGVKLNARNKTQTVVEAIRFGQISLFPRPRTQNDDDLGE